MLAVQTHGRNIQRFAIETLLSHSIHERSNRLENCHLSGYRNWRRIHPYDEDSPSGPCKIDPMCYGGIIEQHRFHPEPKFCGSYGQPCGRNTRGLLQRRLVQIGRKIPIRKESNRRWEGGNDPSILQGYDLEQPDSTATEYVRLEDGREHTTHAVASFQLREWLGRVSLDLIHYHRGIDRHTLRSVRDGKPAQERCWPL